MLRQIARMGKTQFHELPLAKETLQHALKRIELDPVPSSQRRSTTFPTSTAGVWARVTPMWTEWPPRITKDEAIELGIDPETGGSIDVDDVMRRWDSVDFEGSGELKLGSSKHRLKVAPVLLGVSESAVKASLPHLDVGEEGSPAQQSLVDVLGGRKVLEGAEYGPWSTRYCGHQFGVWAGQLGDGRAISLLETESEAGRQEVQVKGAGRTPFSRAADGLAVLRSGVREYLGCEGEFHFRDILTAAIAALGIPTTRALAILTSGVVVIRENGPEPSSLVARLAPSFIRIGHFEALCPGETARNTHNLFLGGGWNTEETKVDENDPLGGQGSLEGLRDLTTWVKDGVMGMKDKSVKDWFKEVVKLNAETVAAWQVYGFMHGVLVSHGFGWRADVQNTDNISILGLTIDYGPYAFMDVWDPNHICNHSDPTGLYSYKNQPNRVLFALDSLAASLLPVLGYEAEHGKPPAEGWSANATKDDVRKWEEAGLEAIKGWNDEFTSTAEKAEKAGWQKRFGLQTYKDSDDRDIVADFLTTLRAHSLDFSASFRLLSYFTPETDAAKFAKKLVGIAAADLPADSVSRAEEGVAGWLKVYAERVKEEAWEGRNEAMKRTNPRFVLRQWVLEETISKMENAIKDGQVDQAREVLARVLDVSKSMTNADCSSLSTPSKPTARQQRVASPHKARRRTSWLASVAWDHAACLVSNAVVAVSCRHAILDPHSVH